MATKSEIGALNEVTEENDLLDRDDDSADDTAQYRELVQVRNSFN